LTIILGTYFWLHLKGKGLAHESAMQRLVERNAAIHSETAGQVPDDGGANDACILSHTQ